jgi:ABC-type multidrug transport system fused ATPase/permease subunit
MPGFARAVVLALGAFWIIDGQWTLGSLLAFQAYLGYVFGPAQFLASANLQLQKALAALQRVSALFKIVPEQNVDTGVPVGRLAGEIEFKSVSFSYDSREMVLEDVSFHIEPGDKVAIVGPSGVGKTTLLSLILRFYGPTKGEIYFDGRPASEYELGSLRRRIGYVSQSPVLVSGTVMENLRYGNTEASKEQVIKAAEAAGIHEFISSLPAGYETEIGERGVNLSEGQKQRISLARALVREPDILVLDEPTAALDSLTEKSILLSLPSLINEKTVFMAVNRLSTAKNSDRILLLDENRLIAFGTHKELIDTSDYYRSVAAAQ